ncbi:MAG: hypothetical protein KF685_04985 [Acidobacteria bacterium]|nr:hypothetical protein [Acidobacteriota bacterium]
MTDEQHNKYIAWAFIAHGSLQVLMFTAVLAVMALFIFAGPGEDIPSGPFAFIGGIVLLLNLLLLSPSFIAAYAMIKRKPWARVAAIIAAALSAMNVPTGTLTAVYALWFFVGEQWHNVYATPRMEDIKLSLNPEDIHSKWEGRYVDVNGEVVYRQPETPDWR